jgi:membrane protein implicated in regulation of membrane protease activity
MWLAWVAILLIAAGIASLLGGVAWLGWPFALAGIVLFAFWMAAIRGKEGRTRASGETRSLPNDEGTDGLHQSTGYAHQGQAPGHRAG